MEKQFLEKNIINIRVDAETPSTIANYTIIRNNESINTPEEIACIISHLKAIQKGYDDGDDYFCIVEDDMDIHKLDFTKLFNYINKAQLQDADNIDLVQLFTNSHPFIIKMFSDYTIGNTDYKEFIIKRKEDYPSAGYYLLSRKGANKLLNLFKLSESYYDLSFSFWTVSDNILYKAINSYILTYPIAVSNIECGSTIHPSHLPNHQNANYIINQIWELNNQISKLT
jgi:GR25 family glycosyltransferase involved in LPS biosynthesis